MKKLFFTLLFPLCLGCTERPEIISESNDPGILWAKSKLNQQINLLHNPSSVEKITIKISPEENEGYSLLHKHNEIIINGKGLNGTMYGMLELAEQLRNFGDFAEVKTKSESARFPFRAIKVNLPWDSYRRSEALQLHTETMRDIKFWESFMDMMAENRFNVLTLWNLHPFNYMIRPTNFPEACGFTDEELAGWQTFWTSLFKYAKARGIETYIVNWNIFVSPEFAAHYKVAEYSKGGEFFTDGDTSEIVKKYTRECVTQLINTYPDLTGMGITLGEGMGAMTPEQREEWLLETIIQGARNADRKIKFIHRVPLSANKGSGGSTDQSVEAMTRETLDTLTCFDSPIWTELKFNWSHAFSSPKLVKVHGGPLTDTYWNPEPTNYKINWMMRNEDFFILRWGQPDFIRNHIRSNGQTYVGGYYVGSECYYPAVDYFTKNDNRPWNYAFERQWLFYKEWGRLLYNPDTPDTVFQYAFTQKYGIQGDLLFEAWNIASKVPLEIATFWNGTWDFTLYSEGFLAKTQAHETGLITLDEMLGRDPLDPEYLSIHEFVDMSINETPIDGNKTDPITLANRIEKDCKEVLTIAQTIKANDNFELQNEVADIKAWAYLGLYFSEKLKAGVDLYTYEQSENISHKTDAVHHLEKAASYWDDLVNVTSPFYREVPLVHLNGLEDVYFSWEKYRDEVRNEIEKVRNK
jgi:hypothetical protein